MFVDTAQRQHTMAAHAAQHRSYEQSTLLVEFHVGSFGLLDKPVKRPMSLREQFSSRACAALQASLRKTCHHGWCTGGPFSVCSTASPAW